MAKAKYILEGLALVVVASVAGYALLRGDPIVDLLNQKWPAITADQQRQKALNLSASSLASLSNANVAFGADVSTIVAVGEQLLKPKGVGAIRLQGAQQLLRLEAQFRHVFGPDDLPDEFKGRNLVIAARPDIQGTITFSAGVSAEIDNQTTPTLRARLLPALERIHVERVTLAQSVDATSFGDALVFALNHYAGNLSAMLSGAPFLQISLPAVLPAVNAQSGPMKISIPGAPNIKISISTKPVDKTFRLAAVASLIDDDHVSVVAQMVPDTPSTTTSTVGIITGTTFGVVRAEFNERLKSGLDIFTLRDGVWVSVSKLLIARMLDDAFSDAKPCFSAEGPIPTQSFSKKVPIPNETTIDCTPSDACDLQKDERDCRRPPNCTHNHDTRDCHGLGKFACEIAKAAQNQAYDRAFDACNAGAWIDDQACETAKGAQNGIYDANKAKCEAAKTAKKDACETAKEGLKRVARTGNFASIDGSMGGPASLRVCLNAVHLSDDLEHLSTNLAVDGEGDISTHIKFVPLDVVGHLACPAEWTDDRTIKVTIPSQPIPVNASISSGAIDGKRVYSGHVDELAVKLHFDPSPTVILLRSANFTLACLPLAGLINAVTLNLGPFIPDLLKDFDYKQKSIEFAFAPQLPAVKLLNHEWDADIINSTHAVTLMGKIKQPAS